MKTSHIIALIVIAVAIGIIVSTVGNTSSYVSFSEAKSLSENGNTTKIHVVGKLKKDDNNEVTGIEESPDKLSFRFVMVDENNESQEVIYANPIPQDFHRSEQVVVVGAYHKETFVADKILLKCPSKYQNNTLDKKN